MTGLFQGVGLTFLASRIQITVRTSSLAFHLPAGTKTPIVVFSSVSDIAPVRGFVQERASQKSASHTVRKVLLFCGCRAPDLDPLVGSPGRIPWYGAEDVGRAGHRRGPSCVLARGRAVRGVGGSSSLSLAAAHLTAALQSRPARPRGRSRRLLAWCTATRASPRTSLSASRRPNDLKGEQDGQHHSSASIRRPHLQSIAHSRRVCLVSACAGALMLSGCHFVVIAKYYI